MYSYLTVYYPKKNLTVYWGVGDKWVKKKEQAYTYRNHTEARLAVQKKLEERRIKNDSLWHRVKITRG